jgi:predicted aconitase
MNGSGRLVALGHSIDPALPQGRKGQVGAGVDENHARWRRQVRGANDHERDDSPEIDPDGLSDADLNAIGYYAGRVAEEYIPVCSGFPLTMTATKLEYLCVPLAVSAGIPMMHVVGVTPEATTLERAFQGRKPEKTITIGR